MAFAMKLWLRFRTIDSLWTQFIRNKYASKCHPSDSVKRCGASTTWLQMLKAKEETEAHMKWLVGKGHFNFWKEYCVLNGKHSDHVNYIDDEADLIVSQVAIDHDSWMPLCKDQLGNCVINFNTCKRSTRFIL